MLPATTPSFETVSQELRTFGARHPEIQAVFVFGSIAAGTTHTGSDVDVAVLTHDETEDGQSLDRRLAYTIDLEDRLNTLVDVAMLNSAGPMLRFQVLRKGKLVYSTDANRTRRFKGAALVEFYDEIVMLEAMQKRAIRRLIGR